MPSQLISCCCVNGCGVLRELLIWSHGTRRFSRSQKYYSAPMPLGLVDHTEAALLQLLAREEGPVCVGIIGYSCASICLYLYRVCIMACCFLSSSYRINQCVTKMRIVNKKVVSLCLGILMCICLCMGLPVARAHESMPYFVQGTKRN